MIHQFPFPKTNEDAAKNLMMLESMLEQNEHHQREEEKRWNALSPDEQRAEKEKPLIELGLKKCPNCGMIPYVWKSLAEGYGFDPVIFCFDEASKLKAEAAYKMPCCENHGESVRKSFYDKRFKSLEELRDWWNSLF